MSRPLSASLRRSIRENANHRCAYCRSAETMIPVTFEVDHIIPPSFGGDDSRDNLCLACPMCNRHKAQKVAAIDPESGSETPLFHPSRDEWEEHFAWDVPATRLVGLTPSGRATIDTLQINRPTMIELRSIWVQLNKHPPTPG